MCVCIYVYIYVCMYAVCSMFVGVYLCMSVCLSVCMYTVSLILCMYAYFDCLRYICQQCISALSSGGRKKLQRPQNLSILSPALGYPSVLEPALHLDAEILISSLKHSLNPRCIHFETSTRRLCTLCAHKCKLLRRQCGTFARTVCNLYVHILDLSAHKSDEYEPKWGWLCILEPSMYDIRIYNALCTVLYDCTYVKFISVCLSVCKYPCLYVCILYVCAYESMHVCHYGCLYVWMYAGLSVCMCIVCLYGCLYVCFVRNVSMYVCIDVCLRHVCTLVCLLAVCMYGLCVCRRPTLIDFLTCVHTVTSAELGWL